ncbi:MAG: MATE family efflux transporter, partial [Clostridia bacterium]|nr:MATE family efflux transporter [Clostridia bacterium]
IMMVFTSIYGIVDGLFVSNYDGTTAFAAINLIMPLYMVMGGVGFMLGAGGTAIVAKTLGEKDEQKANEYFSLIVYVTAGLGALFTLIFLPLLPAISTLLGASGQMHSCCVRYGQIVLLTMPLYMLQNLFQSFFVTAEKPKLGLLVIVFAGITNMVLDAVAVAVLGWGYQGAAIATAVSQAVGGIIPIIYFARKNSSVLRLCKTKFYGKALLKACTNGSSEFLSNISSSVVTMLYNYQLLALAGERGVSAYGAIMYIGFIFVAVFIGYSTGSAPIIGYNYGAQNREELNNVFSKSVKILAVTGVIMSGSAVALAYPLSAMFTSYDPVLLDITVNGMRIHSLHFLLCGFNIFGSAFFTALNNGLISAVISFARTVIFQCSAIIVLPLIFALNGVWSAVIVAEIGSFILTLVFILTQNKHYGYLTSKKLAAQPTNNENLQ